MILKLGIGVATFNRRDILLGTLQRVLSHTLHPYAIVVADDGSSDGTADAVRTLRVPVVQGAWHGVAWNKNRALFYLVDIARCDIVILLEDDTFPIRDGWEMDWMRAAGRYGAVYYARDVSAGGIASGQPDDPIRSTEPHAQCVAYTREAILFGGYLDPRFQAAGYEGIEHAQRLMRAGYGGEPTASGDRGLYYLLRDGVNAAHPASHVTPASMAGNRRIAGAIAVDAGTRLPWTDLAGMREFRAEMALVAPRAGRHLGPAHALGADGRVSAEQAGPGLSRPSPSSPEAAKVAAEATQTTPSRRVGARTAGRRRSN